MNSNLLNNFDVVRAQSEQYCESLLIEDYGLQAMVQTSPPKWHLAHTSWFFETFVLKPFVDTYKAFHPQFEVLFNSYYNGIGKQFPRAQRGLLSRPTVAEVFDYRHSINENVRQLLLNVNDHPEADEIGRRITLGLHHEQQHQELFFTDLKYSYSLNPLYPVYNARAADSQQLAIGSVLQWKEFDGGRISIGHAGQGFCFDNEKPVHEVLLQPFTLATRLVSNREFLAFIDDGGYLRPELWLADGWETLRTERWQAPLYWLFEDGQWYEFSLSGKRPLALDEPVCHVSAYEADAFARWSAARLPTEMEWEAAAAQLPVAGNFVNEAVFHPRAAKGEAFEQMYGDVWEWTSSSYSAYPGFSPAEGAIGEYNGKFMCNQLVLKGGSCVSSAEHLRASYRNFFYPPDRWQFSGIRLARTLA